MASVGMTSTPLAGWWLAGRGDGVDGDEEAVGQDDVRRSGADWWGVWQVLGVDLVDGGEVLDVGVEDRGLDDVAHRGAGRDQDGFQVAQRLFGLGLDPDGDVPGDRVHAGRS